MVYLVLSSYIICELGIVNFVGKNGIFSNQCLMDIVTQHLIKFLRDL